MCGGSFAPLPLCLWAADGYRVRVTDDRPLQVDRQRGEGKKILSLFFSAVFFSASSSCLEDLIRFLAQINFGVAIIREPAELPLSHYRLSNLGCE